MHSDASTGGYLMHAAGGAAAKTPMLGVEIGGGMAADCTRPSPTYASSTYCELHDN